MIRFYLITISFALLFFAFYELSGGSDFEPTQRSTIAQAATPTEVVTDALPAQQMPEPTRADANPTQTTAMVERVALNVSEVPTATAAVERGAAPQGLQVTITDSTESEIVLPGLAELIGGTDAADKIVVTQTSQETAAFEIREISADRVNMRSGPGTSFGIVAKLDLGNQMEVLADNGDGWVRVRPTDGGQVGWVADFLLTQADG